VVVALDGTVVTVGRGRRYEPTGPSGPSGQLAGTHVAHAEVNALAQLGTSRHWDDHMLLTTLEPCGMCHGAVVQSTLRRLVFAAPDPYGGTGAMSFDNPQSQRRPLTVEGPLPDERGAFATLLHIIWLLERPSAGHVVAGHDAALPKLTEYARAVRADFLVAATRGDCSAGWQIAGRAPLDELLRARRQPEQEPSIGS
jgi:tRNA(Arg) A34 adenosine deaminase TadA